MRKILAVASLTVRTVVRSDLFVCLLAVVAVVMLVLPLTLKGDGTVQGQARVSMQYAIGLVGLILAVSSVWSACGVTAVEIEERQAQGLVTKPVRRASIWLGKWMGLIAINAAVLMFAGLLLCVAMAGVAHRCGDPGAIRALREEVLVARQVVDPEGRDACGADAETPPSTALSPFLGREADVVEPGGSKRWSFRVPESASLGRTPSIRFNMSSPRQIEMKPLTVRWEVWASDRSDRYCYTGRVFVGSPCHFPVPWSAVGKGGLVTVEYRNAQSDPPAAVVFDRDHPVSVLIARGSFEANLLKALLVMLFKLAVVCALGLTAGCLLSVPVAGFVSCSVVCLFLSADLLDSNVAVVAGDRHGGKSQPELLERFVRVEFRVLKTITDPIIRLDVVSPLTRGELIPWRTVGKSFLACMVLYSGVLFAGGAWLFSRRELGLPAD